MRLRYLVLLFFGGCVGVYVLAAFRVKPNVHGAVVDYFNFVKFKIAVREEIFFDEDRQVFFVDFDLPLGGLRLLGHRTVPTWNSRRSRLCPRPIGRAGPPARTFPGPLL